MEQSLVEFHSTCVDSIIKSTCLRVIGDPQIRCPVFGRTTNDSAYTPFLQSVPLDVDLVDALRGF